MALRLPQAELWIQTAPCEVRSDCQLARYHLHVEDQIYYDFAEMDRIFGKNGWEVAEEPVKADDSAMDKIKGWINAGFTTSHHGFTPSRQSDHRNHVHIAVTDPPDPLKPNDLTGVDPKTGKVRRFQPGDKPAGFVTGQGVRSDHSAGGAVDINVISTLPQGIRPVISTSWSDPSADPVGDIMAMSRLLRNTQIVQ
jgi:hypothetical protein